MRGRAEIVSATRSLEADLPIAYFGPEGQSGFAAQPRLARIRAASSVQQATIGTRAAKVIAPGRGPIVITSYSIHYTKLYDMVSAPAIAKERNIGLSETKREGSAEYQTLVKRNNFV